MSVTASTISLNKDAILLYLYESMQVKQLKAMIIIITNITMHFTLNSLLYWISSIAGVMDI